MSILINDNLQNQSPKPLDERYGRYTDTSAALSAIPSHQRFIGLTVGIGTPVEEYWFKNGVLNTDLVVKLPVINYPVTSVNGQTGAVVLTTTDIAEGTNEYYTDAKVDAVLVAEDVTKQGNTFNGADQLVQLDATAKLPAVDGSNLTNLPIPPSTGGNLYLFYNY
jgi:hypothetical protein